MRSATHIFSITKENMKVMRAFFSDQAAGYRMLRLALAVLLSVHGWHRIYEGSLPILGRILTEEGFPFGYALACAITFLEAGGGLALALGVLVVPICLALSVFYLVGIYLFHWQQGFFVVGPGRGGWEFSAMLIVCLLITAWARRARPYF